MAYPPGLTENPWKIAYEYNLDHMEDLMYEKWPLPPDHEVVRLASIKNSICLYIKAEKDRT